MVRSRSLALILFVFANTALASDLLRPCIGITVTNLSPDMCNALEIGETHGAFVAEVREHSPAEEAGFRAADVIQMVNGQPIHSAVEVATWVRRTGVGGHFQALVLRPGGHATLSGFIGSMQDKRGCSREGT